MKTMWVTCFRRRRARIPVGLSTGQEGRRGWGEGGWRGRTDCNRRLKTQAGKTREEEGGGEAGIKIVD